jgi:hypothetical protein
VLDAMVEAKELPTPTPPMSQYVDLSYLTK